MNMDDEWLATIDEDKAFKSWLEEDVFPDGDWFCASKFEASELLYDGAAKTSRIKKLLQVLSFKSRFTKDALNSAIHEAGIRTFLDNEAKWFHVTIQAGFERKVESTGSYRYKYALVPLSELAQEDAPSASYMTYAGIASSTNNWLLLLEGNTISLYGSQAFIDSVKKILNIK